MASGRVKVKQGEDLSPSNIQRVISALEADKPVTKKEACQMLKISYNTARLGKIIEEHKERITYAQKRRKVMRNKPVDKMDRRTIIQGYLSGDSLTTISESVFRTTSVVKNILSGYNVPIRDRSYTYKDPVLLGDDSDADDYKKGDLVFSARYNSPAYIDNVVSTGTYGSVYRIWVLGNNCRWANQPYYELADLRKVQQDLNIEVTELDGNEIQQLIAEGLLKANKKLKKAYSD